MPRHDEETPLSNYVASATTVCAEDIALSTISGLPSHVDYVGYAYTVPLQKEDWSLSYLTKEGEALSRFAQSWMATAEDNKAVKDVRWRCKRALKGRFRDVRCELYGSRHSKLATTSSDIDICVFSDAESRKIEKLEDEGASMTELKKKKASLAYNICGCLKKSHDFEQVKAIVRARIPVVKAIDVTSGLAIDVVFDNAVAVQNSALLKRYAEKDIRAKDLMLLVKIWAKFLLRDASAGGLSSYAHCVLAIYTLQSHKVVPNLQRENDPFKKNRRVLLGELLLSHFRLLSKFFAQENSGTFSIRIGEIISPTPKRFSKNLASIEDPYEHLGTSHPRDLGDVLIPIGLREIKEEADRALDIFKVARREQDPRKIIRSLLENSNR